MSEGMCKCKRCVRSRIVNMNRYFKRRGQSHRVKPLPLDKKKYGAPLCQCKRCITNRVVRKKHYYEKECATGGRDKRVGADFKPFGPGRYDWDRTTERDYGYAKRTGA